MDGKLSGAWVEVLEQAWRNVVAEKTANPVVVDMTQVTLVDNHGKALLRKILESGARFNIADFYMKSIFAEIESELQR